MPMSLPIMSFGSTAMQFNNTARTLAPGVSSNVEQPRWTSWPSFVTPPILEVPPRIWYNPAVVAGPDLASPSLGAIFVSGGPYEELIRVGEIPAPPKPRKIDMLKRTERAIRQVLGRRAPGA